MNLPLRHSSHRPRRLAGQAGMTLVEVMVALVLGLFLIIAMVSLLTNVNRNNSELSKANRLIENGRFSAQLLVNDISHAGYLGGFVPKFDDLTSTVVPNDVPAAVPDPCVAIGSWTAAYRNGLMGIPVAAYDLGSPVPANTSLPVCPASTPIVASAKANTDVLVVRHADTTACTPPNGTCPEASVVYLQVPDCTLSTSPGYSASPYLLTNTATPNSLSVFNLRKRDCTAAASGTPAELRKFVSNLYYIRSYATTAGDGIPTLMRSQFANGQQQTAEALIENIEGFRVEFGLDTVSDAGAAVDFTQAVTWANASTLTSPTNRGDGLADGAYVRCTAATPCTPAQLMNAVAVRVYLLVRSDAETPGYTDNKVYCLASSCATPASTSCPAGATANTQPLLGPFCDHYKRHLFTQTVRLTNVSMRRETP